MATNCEGCGNVLVLTKHAWNKKFCSTDCYKLKVGAKSPFNGISTGTVGAIAELVVSADLMKRGYEVYRALSQSSSCDLLALKNGILTKIEVKTGYTNGATGSLSFPKGKMRADIFAVVDHRNGTITYIPEI